MSKPIQKSHKKLYIWIVATAVAIPLILALLFMAFALQVPQFSYYYVKCGFREPVKVEHNSSQSYTYLLPSSPSYESAVLFVTDYYCTEQEAVRAGYEPSDQ